jgi:superfamily I DNA/RNA helicase
MAVIYTRKTSRDERRVSIPELLSRALEARGLMSTWMAEDYRSKRGYDITTESVTISTIHSAKGLDYACVFLVGLDEVEPDGWSEQQVRNLVYVGITRARHRLVIPYVTETELISELRRCL